jgi:tRNA1(Val) A37 N6-methylase TrmN6
MKQLSQSLIVVCFFLVVIGAVIFPFIPNNNDPVQTPNRVKSEEVKVVGQDSSDQYAAEAELPCLIHCNPPYNTSATERSNLKNERTESQIDRVTYHHTGELELPCLTYCNPPYHTSMLPATESNTSSNTSLDEYNTPCLIYCNPPYNASVDISLSRVVTSGLSSEPADEQ